MKVYSLICLCFVALGLSAQQVDAVFVVNKKIVLLPTIDTMLSNKTYHFTAKGIALKDISAAVFTSGKVTVGDTDIVLRINPIQRKVQQDTLQLYINIDGKQQQIFSKVFTVLKLPTVQPSTFSNVRGDRSIAVYWWLNTRQLYAQDTLPLRIIKGERQNVRACAIVPVFKELGIKSFKVDISCDGKVQQFTALSGVTAQIEDALKTITPGCTVKLYDINTYSADGVRIVGPYNIYISP